MSHMASTIPWRNPNPSWNRGCPNKFFLQTELDPVAARVILRVTKVCPSGRLVVEKNSAARMQAVGFR